MEMDMEMEMGMRRDCAMRTTSRILFLPIVYYLLSAGNCPQKMR